MSRVSVLLVDDKDIFLRIAGRYLQEYCQEEVALMGTAAGAEEAVGLIDKLRPDMVLVDLSMPEVSGLEFIPRLRAAQPQIGIIALTFLDDDLYRQAALAAGADEFVPKASLTTDLLPAIRRVMKTAPGS